MDLVGDVVGGGVDFGDGYFGCEGGVFGVEGGELFVFGGEAVDWGVLLVSLGLFFFCVWGKGEGGYVRFAMAAPGCVEFQENVLVLVDDLLVVMRHDDLHAAFLFLGDRLALHAGRDLAVDKVLNESADVVMRDLLALVEGEFLVFDGFLDGKSGPLVGLKVEITCMRTKGLGIDGGEIDLAFVLLGDGLQGLGERFTLFWGLRKDIAKGNASLWI